MGGGDVENVKYIDISCYNQCQFYTFILITGYVEIIKQQKII